MRLDARVDVGEGADRAGDRAGGDLRSRRASALPGARELGVGQRQLQAEGGRLGVDAVAAADRRRELVLEGAPLQRRQQRVDVREQDVGRAAELHREAGVEDVGRGHALVQEARLRADDLGDVGQEGDDVVLHLALDLVDALDVERAALPQRLRSPAGICPSCSMASAASVSISSQISYLVRADQRRPFRAGIAGIMDALQAAEPGLRAQAQIEWVWKGELVDVGCRK